MRPRNHLSPQEIPFYYSWLGHSTQLDDNLLERLAWRDAKIKKLPDRVKELVATRAACASILQLNGRIRSDPGPAGPADKICINVDVGDIIYYKSYSNPG
jgi:hypothetical protein